MSIYAAFDKRVVGRLALALGCILTFNLVALRTWAWAQSGHVQDGQMIAVSGTNVGVPACASCHGSAGEGAPAVGIPRLAGFDKDYLERELDAFRNGTRASPVMTQYALALTPEQVASVSAYYASLAMPSSSDVDVDTVTSPGQGRGVALAGNLAAGVPSCASCHGAAGQGYHSAPALDGQSAAYISAQLAAWKHGARAEGPDFFMSLIAPRLSDSDITAVSAYYASLPVSQNTSHPPKPTSGP